MKFRNALLIGSCLLGMTNSAMAQHLHWKPTSKDRQFTCLYGEIEVLSSNKFIYYCGVNWWPGNPAGGYTGIQNQDKDQHNMIFSIWDTSPTLHPDTVEKDSRTVASRFGGEGTGAHTHLDYNWKLGKPYRYFATKEHDTSGKNVLTKLYFYDDQLRKWVHEATISNPDDGHISVSTFGGGLNAFLENFLGQEKEKPKVALYRLWLGTKPDNMENVTTGSGDGNWGVLGDTFYLAEGNESDVDAVFQKSHKRGQTVIRGKADRSTLQVPERKLPVRTIRELDKLVSSKTR